MSLKENFLLYVCHSQAHCPLRAEISHGPFCTLSTAQQHTHTENWPPREQMNHYHHTGQILDPCIPARFPSGS